MPVAIVSPCPLLEERMEAVCEMEESKIHSSDRTASVRWSRQLLTPDLLDLLHLACLPWREMVVWTLGKSDCA